MSQLSPTERAWATGLVVFAAVMMMASGIFQALQGLVALVNSEFYVVGDEYTFKFDVTTWGWIHLLIGIGVVLVGAYLYQGASWARWTAIFILGVSMIANFMWLPYYPMWGLVILALDVAVIWALASLD